MKAPHLLLIGGWDGQVARILGSPTSLTLFQNAANATEFQRTVATRVAIVDYRDSARVVETAEAIHRLHPFDGALSLTESGLAAAAAVRGALGLPGNSVEAIHLASDKAEMRSRLHRVGIHGPHHRRCSSIGDAAEARQQIGRRMIMKPVNGSGSEGVVAVDLADDIEEAWQYVTAASGQSGVLVEEYIDGIEYSVESFSVNGVHTPLTVTRKLTTGYPNFVETGHVMPSGGNRRKEIMSFVTEVLTAIGFTSGPAHTEVIDDGSIVQLVEVNARIGGDRIWELVEMTTGVDLIRAAVCAELGLHVDVATRTLSQHVAIRFFSDTCFDELAKRCESASQMQGVVRVAMTSQEPLRSRSIRSSDDRIGYVIAVGETENEALENAHAAAAAMERR